MYQIRSIARCVDESSKTINIEHETDNKGYIPELFTSRRDPQEGDHGNSMDDSRTVSDMPSLKLNRKSTACETEIDTIQNGSTQAVHGDYEELETPVKMKRKPSLLAKLCFDEVNRQCGFENIILESPDAEDCDNGSQGFLGKRCGQEQVCSEDMQSYVMRLGGVIASKKQTGGETFYHIICLSNHKFTLMDNERKQWCMTCETILSNISRFVREKNGKLLSTSLQSEIKIQCAEGHEWSVPALKATKAWCKECKKKKKSLLKEMIEQENLQINEERRQKQNIMLEEARLRMQQGEKVQHE